MDYLSKLNREQKEAAMYTEGPLLIWRERETAEQEYHDTHRIAYMIDEKGVDPYNILAVTFTNKAAREMRDEGRGSCWEAVVCASWIHDLPLGVPEDTEDAHAEVLGYGRDFTVYDPTDQKTLVKNIIKELGYRREAIHSVLFSGHYQQVQGTAYHVAGIPEGIRRRYQSRDGG